MTLYVFTIATGEYKNYLNNFLNSINNFFPNENKELFILSDGLIDKNDTYIESTHINIIPFIDFPYPYINMNKFQIINEYLKRLNIDYISYFDSDTIFINKDDMFWDKMKEDILQNKFIISKHPFYEDEKYYKNYDKFSNFININFDLYKNYKDYDEGDYVYFDFIDKTNSWLITSFFIVHKDLLNDYANKIKILINKCERSFLKKLKFSDESHFNLLYYFDFLNNKTEEHYIINNYITTNNASNEFSDNVFICQKYNMINKFSSKYSSSKNLILLYVDENFDNEFLYKLYSKYIFNFNFYCISKESNNTLLEYVHNKYMFNKRLIFWDSWFGKNNILFNEELYEKYLNDEINDDLKFKNILFIKKPNEEILNIDFNNLIKNNIQFKSDKSIDENKIFENISYMYYTSDFIKQNYIKYD